jgi:hypothetical protein
MLASIGNQQIHLSINQSISPSIYQFIESILAVVDVILRAALHLEAGPIRCVRGLKSSLVIGQKAQIGPNPFTPRGRADLVVWFF